MSELIALNTFKCKEVPSVKVEILNVSNELLLGIRTNTHLTYLSKQVAALGLSVHYAKLFKITLKRFKKRSKKDLQSFRFNNRNGGLGMTVDDSTRESVASALGRELIYQDSIFKTISERFEKLGRPASPIHKKRYQIKGSTLINNDRGTAPGLLINEGTQVILLPGPTHELVPMFEKDVLPLLRDNDAQETGNLSIQLRVCGMGESTVEETLKPIANTHPSFLEFAFCVHLGLVDTWLTCLSSDISSMELFKIGEECGVLLGDNFVGFGEGSLAEVIFQKLRKRNRTLAVAESCTRRFDGNALRIFRVSKVFKGGVLRYANEVKVLQLGVPEEILDNMERSVVSVPLLWHREPQKIFQPIMG